jgi:hypothetical protein
MTLPRIDYLAIDPAGHIHTMRGTPTEGATLDNELGLAPLPDGWFAIDDRILLPDGRMRSDVSDRRPWADAARGQGSAT